MPRSAGTVARGYGAAHKRRRRADAELVEAGHGVCWRCGLPIVPRKIRRADGRLVSNWHLGHDDFDRSLYRGPEHERCNTVAAGRSRARRRGRRTPRVPGGVFGPLST